MDLPRLIRAADAGATGILCLVAALGVVLAWAAGLLLQLDLALLAVACVAPRFHRHRERR